jgi:hypothetical protein
MVPVQNFSQAKAPLGTMAPSGAIGLKIALVVNDDRQITTGDKFCLIDG